MIRFESDGMFVRQGFKLFCGERGVELHIAAGEAHWRVGVVEHHNHVLTEMRTRLTCEEEEDWDPHFLVQCAAVETKYTRGIYIGHSPSQWCQRRNLIDEIVGGRSLKGKSSHQFNAHTKSVMEAEKIWR